MSYFVCGAIWMSDSGSEEAQALARRVSIRALEEGMLLQLGCNVAQQLVRDMVIGTENGTEGIPYLITDSPLNNVSDELVCPTVLVGPDGDEIFRRNAKRLAKFFNSVLNERLVQRADLLVIDAFDTSVPTKTIQVANLERELLSAWDKRNEDFFFKLVLRKLQSIPPFEP